MKRETAALCLFALIALSCVPDTTAYFCRYSSYQVEPAILLRLTKGFIKTCDYRVVAGKPKTHRDIALSKVVVENPKVSKLKRCSSIKMTMLDMADYKSFKACQDVQILWPILFAKRSQCSKYQKSGRC